LAKSLDSLREYSTSVMSYHEQFRFVLELSIHKGVGGM
jgi:hypothetical protein